MKIIIIGIFLLLAGCSNSSNTPTPVQVTETSTNPVDVFTANGTGIRLIQSNGLVLTTVIPTVEGTSFVVQLNGCKLSYDVAVIDPVNYAYWLAQSVTIDVDMSALICANPRTYAYDAPVWNGTIVEAWFTIN